jgi:molecular chaperone DnaJ
MADQEIRRDWLEKDFYKSLGVSKTADAAEIKKKYRKLARELHPDTNPDNHRAEEKFKEVSEAYDVLSDAKQRKAYDEARASYGGGRLRFPGSAGRPGAHGGFDKNDLSDLFSRAQQGAPGGFSDVFGGLFNRGTGSPGSGQRRQGPKRGTDIESEVTLDFNDALHGVTLPLQLTTQDTCHTFHGTGARPGSSPQVCPVCQGSGAQVRNQGGFAFSEPCQACQGLGVIIEDPCSTCHGSGEAASTRTINARIPAGVKDGQRIRLKAKGSAGENGGPNGDLLLLVHVGPHPVFGRDGANVTITVPVSFDEAALGAQVNVPTPDGGTVTVKIPAGTPNGRKLRVKGKGVQSKTVTGDLVVTVTVEVPVELSPSERTAIEGFRKAREGKDPRAELFERLGGE